MSIRRVLPHIPLTVATSAKYNVAYKIISNFMFQYILLLSSYIVSMEIAYFVHNTPKYICRLDGYSLRVVPTVDRLNICDTVTIKLIGD